MEKLLLTPEEAAEVLSIGRTKVYELVRGGLLRSVRIGTSRRIARDALDDFVACLGATTDDSERLNPLRRRVDVG